MINRETDRIIIQIEQMDDPESLRAIGQASASRLRVVGVNARWEREMVVRRKPIRKRVILIWSFVLLTFILTVFVWMLPPMFGGTSLLTIPFGIWTNQHIGTLGIMAALQVVVFVIVYFLVRGISWIYDTAKREGARAGS